MARADVERLRAIKTFPSLVKYLRDELGWPIETENFEDLTFDYQPEELGIDSEVAAKIKEIKQLRPLETGQPWGIFFIIFEPKRLPIVVLRRILQKLVIKKRASASRSQMRAWNLHDLLFISSYGVTDERSITFAHFSENPDSDELPTLRVLGWDDKDTILHLDDAHEVLKQKLCWPDDPTNLDVWRQRWSEAFTLRYRETITTAQELAVTLAHLAKRIRDRVNTILSVESDKGPFRQLYEAFREALIHDLQEDDFSDMYAQTITYGLLAARVSRPAGVLAENLAQLVSNPFLKETLSTFLTYGGKKGKIDFDETGILDVVELLNSPETHIEAVLRDFGNKTQREDPVIHFYELFLSEYDKKKKVERGVFYTPQPVVSYIVRSVHELLQLEFGLEDGLASTVTWGEMIKKNKNIALPKGVSVDEPFIQILDPAVGTGTFLVEVIDIIYRTMISKWEKAGRSHNDIPRMWDEFVGTHLLSRLYGYELMMAPYVIADIKLTLKLSELSRQLGELFYHGERKGRFNIYLTNSLEPPSPVADDKLADLFLPLAREAAAVNRIKTSKPFTIVMGNPPYSSSISEPQWLMESLEEWKRGLNETKMDLNREEWKFLRLGQLTIERVPEGVLGFVINRDFLDGVTKRRMRQSLQETYSLRNIVDLNGDLKGNIADENVFAITQGVCIAVLCKSSRKSHRFASLVGTRIDKFLTLDSAGEMEKLLKPWNPSSPYFRWLPFKNELSANAEEEYLQWRPINEIFKVYSSGIQTKRDRLCIHFTEAELWSAVERFNTLSEQRAREEFLLGDDGRDWTIANAKKDLKASGPSRRFITKILYRPFDIRYTYWTGRTKGFLAYPRRDVMRHVIGNDNVGLIFNRQIVGASVSHFGVSQIPICHGTFYLGNKGQDYFAPLYLLPDEDSLLNKGDGVDTNIAPDVCSFFSKCLGVPTNKLNRDSVLYYVYAILHSINYRQRYSDFLKRDFPRVPLTNNPHLFDALTRLGRRLVYFHLQKDPDLNRPTISFIGNKNVEIENVYFENDHVFIDERCSAGFKGLNEAEWKFYYGGYQVCEKWLKDRKGRSLTKEDIEHYQKFVTAINETIRIMAEIDKIIDEHGGWPLK